MYLETTVMCSHFILHHVLAVNMHRLQQCVAFDNSRWRPATQSEADTSRH